MIEDIDVLPKSTSKLRETNRNLCTVRQSDGSTFIDVFVLKKVIGESWIKIEESKPRSELYL